jgi:cell division protein FtsI/penicillin-binding protein 2
MGRSLRFAFAGGWLAGAAAVVVACKTQHAPPSDPASAEATALALAHSEPAPHEAEPVEPAPPPPPQAPLSGLDLAHISADDGTSPASPERGRNLDEGLTAPVDSGAARLTLDPELQRTALQIVTAHHVPEAAVVLIDVATGRLLVYASHIEGAASRDLCAEATAPSASVFKIVTAAALVEDAHLGPDTRQCYSGGEQRITAADLVEDPQRDRWCTTLAGAVGRSINTAIARLAKGHLTPAQLDAMARNFGYGQPVPFDAPVQPSGVRIPPEPLDFARTSAGFWNTTLSPLQAAEISAIVARHGEAVRPRIVDRVTSADGTVLWSAPESTSPRRAIARETADQLTTMMERTVTEGTSFRAFHDGRGGAFLPGIAVAGKTGTLTDAEARRYYTWFTGFAPSRPQAGERQVAVAVLVVNGPTWEVKANVVARDVLRAYFAEKGAQGVSRPSPGAVARRRRR